MPIVEPAELLGHITTEDGRRIPHYKVKTETTITNIDTGQEYESEAAMQADIDDPNDDCGDCLNAFHSSKDDRSWKGPGYLMKSLKGRKLYE